MADEEESFRSRAKVNNESPGWNSIESEGMRTVVVGGRFQSRPLNRRNSLYFLRRFAYSLEGRLFDTVALEKMEVG